MKIIKCPLCSNTLIPRDNLIPINYECYCKMGFSGASFMISFKDDVQTYWFSTSLTEDKCIFSRKIGEFGDNITSMSKKIANPINNNYWKWSELISIPEFCPLDLNESILDQINKISTKLEKLVIFS
jgi:hypothetical protein